MSFEMTARFQPPWILLTLLSFASWSVAVDFKIVYEWKYVDYEWENEIQKQNAVDAGEYDYTKIITNDFEKISGDRVLVTTPRYFKNPASLSTVSTETGHGGPLLEPYPSWDWHEIGNCNGITSVNRIFLDKCNRVWVVDSGKIGDYQICPAQILAFDSETDELLKRVEIPDTLSHNSEDSSQGRLEIQFVETNGDLCSETWVYIGDPEGYGLVIWDGSDIWRLENDETYAPDPGATTFSAGGKNATLKLGTSFSIIPPPGFVNEQYLLLKPVASFSDRAVKLRDLHNSKTGSNVTYYKCNITLPSQKTVRANSDFGILVGTLASYLVEACYYLEGPLTLNFFGEILEEDDFSSAAKIIKEDRSYLEYEEYWVMSNSLPKFTLDIINFEDINFKILSVNVGDIFNATLCVPNSQSVERIEDKFFLPYVTTNSTLISVFTTQSSQQP